MEGDGVRITPRGARLAGIAAILFVTIAASTTHVRAMPAFARKYHTSCQTCHLAYPNLTPFGEAFRLNGYRFPEGSDPSMSKDEPVALGAEGYKKMWPKAVWPGEIPGLPPMSMVIENEVVYDNEAKMTSFDGLPSEVALLTGGTFGEHTSFYGELEFAREDEAVETELQRINIQFRPRSSPLLQIKVGSFEPGLLLVSNHRRLTDHGHLLLSMPAGDNEWTAEPYQQGIEFFGVASHRLLYNAGYVEGSGNASNNSKDYYARLAYKFGGLRLDGTTPEGSEASLASNPKPWSEKSVRVSGFYYRGKPLLEETTSTLQTDPGCTTLPCDVVVVETTLSQNDPFKIYGGDVAWNYENLIVNAGFAERTDRHPFLDSPTDTDVDIKNRFAQVAYVAYPWLIPAARWESAEIEGDKTERLSLTVDVLIRANVKGFVAADQVKSDGGSYETEEVVGGVVFGF
jgi:hypothetical protein